jgi:AcrR family transcriptional regulator
MSLPPGRRDWLSLAAYWMTISYMMTACVVIDVSATTASVVISLVGMPRWESDAQGRLERATLELFETQGFERTSVAQIARTAGLTERSFYRYFRDKREVLFAGDELRAHLVAHVEAADPGLTPIEALLTALGTADEVFRPREFLLRRVRVIAAGPALAERDLIKLADIADALARALERRGVEPGKARFIIDVAIAVCLPARHVPLAGRPGRGPLRVRRPDRHRTVRGGRAAGPDGRLSLPQNREGAGRRLGCGIGRLSSWRLLWLGLGCWRGIRSRFRCRRWRR